MSLTPDLPPMCSHASQAILSIYKDLSAEESADFDRHHADCAVCQNLTRDFVTLGRLLDRWPVAEPDPVRWSNLGSAVRAALASQEACELQAEYEEAFATALSEQDLGDETKIHLASCGSCRALFEEYRKVSDWVGRAPVPPPDPVRWSNLKSDVLAAVEKPRFTGRITQRKRSTHKLLLQFAAALLFMAGGAVLAHYWSARAPSAGKIQLWQQQATRACDQGEWNKARGLLQKVIEGGSLRSDSHLLVISSVNELEAVRRYESLPKDLKGRRAALSRFIYSFPASRMTRRALAEYKTLRQSKIKERSGHGGTTIDDMDPIPHFNTALAHSIRPFSQSRDFEEVLVSFKNPDISNAAHIQMALINLESGSKDRARDHLSMVTGQNPAQRFAREQLERLRSR